MEELDQFLVDFYGKFAPDKKIDASKIGEIKSTYGSDYDLLIKDLYGTYAPDKYSDEKLAAIKSTYNFSTPATQQPVTQQFSPPPFAPSQAQQPIIGKPDPLSSAAAPMVQPAQPIQPINQAQVQQGIEAQFAPKEQAPMGVNELFSANVPVSPQVPTGTIMGEKIDDISREFLQAYVPEAIEAKSYDGSVEAKYNEISEKLRKHKLATEFVPDPFSGKDEQQQRAYADAQKDILPEQEVFALETAIKTLSPYRNKYYGNIAEKYEPVLDEKRKELEEKLDEMQRQKSKRSGELKGSDLSIGGYSGLGQMMQVTIPSKEEQDLAEQLSAVDIAEKYIQRIKDLSEVSSDNYLAAAGAAFADKDYLNLVSFGMKKLVEDVGVLSIMDKMAKGEKVSDDERAMVELYNSFNTLRSNQDRPVTYDIVDSFLESLPYMAEIAFSGGVIGGAKASAKKFALRQLEKTGIESAFAKGIVSKGTSAVVMGAIQPAAAPTMVARNVVQRQMGNFVPEYDPQTGEFNVRRAENAEDLTESFLKGYGMAGITIIAESSGEMLIDKPVKAIGKALGINMGGKGISGQITKAADSFRKQAKFGGTAGEVGEEYLEKALNTLLVEPTGAEQERLKAEGKSQWDDFFNTREGITIIGSVLLTQGMFATTKIPTAIAREKQGGVVRKAAQALPQDIREPLVRAMQEQDPVKRADAIISTGVKDIQDPVKRKAVLNYMKEKVRHDYMTGVELGNDEFDAVEKSVSLLEKSVYKKSSTGQEIVYGVDNDGKYFYLIDNDLSGENYIVVYDDGVQKQLSGDKVSALSQPISLDEAKNRSIEQIMKFGDLREQALDEQEAEFVEQLAAETPAPMPAEQVEEFSPPPTPIIENQEALPVETIDVPQAESEVITPKADIEAQVEPVSVQSEPISEPVIAEARGFTEGKSLSVLKSAAKDKYGDKKGADFYDVAIRLVNPNQNEIIEIRSNGVVVKEGEKYIFKPFVNTDFAKSKWGIGTDRQSVDVTEQFVEKTPEKVVYITENNPELKFLEEQLPSKKPTKDKLVDIDDIGGGEVRVLPIAQKIKIKTNEEALANSTSKDENRPSMTGVFYDAERQVLAATDAMVMTVIPEKIEGKSRIINPKTKEIIDGTFPQYSKVVPVNYHKLNIDVNEIFAKINGLDRANSFVSGTQPILAKFSYNGIDTFFSPSILKRGLLSLLESGTNKVVFELPDAPNRPLIIRDVDNEGKFSLIMPTISNEKSIAKTVVDTDADIDLDILRREIDSLSNERSWLEQYHKREFDEATKKGDKSSIGYHKEGLAEAKAETDEKIKNLKRILSDNTDKQGAKEDVQQLSPPVDALKDTESTAKALEVVDRFGKKASVIGDLLGIDISDNTTDIEIDKSTSKKIYEVGLKTGEVSDTFESFKKTMMGESVPLNFFKNEISEAYHAAKKDGSNPELVKAVEELLGQKASPTVQVEQSPRTRVESEIISAIKTNNPTLTEKEISEQVLHSLTLLDAMASTWSRETKQSVDDYWAKINVTPDKAVAGVKDVSNKETEQQGAFGSFLPRPDGTTIIGLFKGANATTILHEIGGHYGRRALAQMAQTSPMWAKRYEAVKEWAGVKGENWTVKAEEKFARGFENYVRTGKLPTNASIQLKRAFEFLKEFFANVYKNAKADAAINQSIPQEIIDVFNAMLGIEPTVEELTQSIQKIEEEILRENKSKTTGDKIAQAGLLSENEAKLFEESTKDAENAVTLAEASQLSDDIAKATEKIKKAENVLATGAQNSWVNNFVEDIDGYEAPLFQDESQPLFQSPEGRKQTLQDLENDIKAAIKAEQKRLGKDFTHEELYLTALETFENSDIVKALDESIDRVFSADLKERMLSNLEKHYGVGLIEKMGVKAGKSKEQIEIEKNAHIDLRATKHGQPVINSNLLPQAPKDAITFATKISEDYRKLGDKNRSSWSFTIGSVDVERGVLTEAKRIMYETYYNSDANKKAIETAAALLDMYKSDLKTLGEILLSTPTQESVIVFARARELFMTAIGDQMIEAERKGNTALYEDLAAMYFDMFKVQTQSFSVYGVATGGSSVHLKNLGVAVAARIDKDIEQSNEKKMILDGENTVGQLLGIISKLNKQDAKQLLSLIQENMASGGSLANFIRTKTDAIPEQKRDYRRRDSVGRALRRVDDDVKKNALDFLAHAKQLMQQGALMQMTITNNEIAFLADVVKNGFLPQGYYMEQDIRDMVQDFWTRSELSQEDMDAVLNSPYNAKKSILEHIGQQEKYEALRLYGLEEKKKTKKAEVSTDTKPLSATEYRSQINNAIKDIVNAHYSERDNLQRTLVNKLVDDLNISPRMAKEIVQEINDSVGKKIKERAVRQLDSKLKEIKRQPLSEREKKSIFSKVDDAINLGALQDDAYVSLFTQKFGLREKLNKEEISNLEMLSARVRLLNGRGISSAIAMSEMANYMYTLKPKDTGFRNIINLVIAMRYASMLSGITTHVVNIATAAVNILSAPVLNALSPLSWVSAYRNFNNLSDVNKAALYARYNPFTDLFRAYRDMFAGGKRGIAPFNIVWNQGLLGSSDKYSEIVRTKELTPSELEKNTYGVGQRFKPISLGRFSKGSQINNPYNILKYVGRALYAEDQFMFEIAHTMETAKQLRKQGLSEGLSGKKLEDYVNRALYADALSKEELQEIDEQIGVEINALLMSDTYAGSQPIAMRRLRDVEYIDQNGVVKKGKTMFDSNGQVVPLIKNIWDKRRMEIMHEKVVSSKETRDSLKQSSRDEIFTSSRHGTMASMADAINRLTSKNTAVKLATMPFIPFTTVLGNIGEYMLDLMPFYGFMRYYGISASHIARATVDSGRSGGTFSPRQQQGASLREDAIRGEKQFARAYFGTLLTMVLLASLFDSDDDSWMQVHGSMQHLSRESDNWKERAYSVRFGRGENATYFKYANMPLFNIIFSLVGNLNDRYIELTTTKQIPQDAGAWDFVSEMGVLGTLSMAFFSSVNVLSESTLLEGIRNMIDFYSEASGYFDTDEKRYSVSNLGSATRQERAAMTLRRSLVEVLKNYGQVVSSPNPLNLNLIQQIMKWTISANSKDKKSFEGIAWSLLGVSQIVGADNYGAFGEPVKSFPGGGQFNFLSSYEDNENRRLYEVLEDNKYVPYPPSNRMYKRSDGEMGYLTAQELSQYTKNVGLIFKEKMNEYLKGSYPTDRSVYIEDENGVLLPKSRGEIAKKRTEALEEASANMLSVFAEKESNVKGGRQPRKASNRGARKPRRP